MFHLYRRLLLARIKKLLTPNDQKYFDILANIYIESLKRGYVFVADDQKTDYILLQKQTELVYLNGGMPEYLNNDVLDDPQIFDMMMTRIQLIPSKHEVLLNLVESL
jgi:hypothetical protein